jgi:hypothetical protein
MDPERQPQQSPERTVEKQPTAEKRRDLEKYREQQERAGERLAEEQVEQAEAARHRIEELPDQSESAPQVKRSAHYSPFEKSQTKKDSYKKTLKQMQRQLPSKRSQAFSRLIHQPTVETVSEMAAKTVFRPSLILGASLGGLVGGSAIYLAARNYGFEISGSEFLLFAAIGAALGIVFELIGKVFKLIFKRT